MRKNYFLFFLFFVSLLTYGQVQIGNNIDGEWFEEQTGKSVSISGDGRVVAIGGPSSTTSAGVVRIYENKSGVWTKTGEVLGEATYEFNGFSVSLSSDGLTLAIGSPEHKSGTLKTGRVRVYKYIDNTWTKMGGNIIGELDYEKSGASVSLSANGQIVAIGAPSYSSKGRVRIYEYNQNSKTWKNIGIIDGENSGDQNGYSISLSADGTTIAIGAPTRDSYGVDAGYVRVFKNINNTWTKIGGDIIGEDLSDRFGFSVSLSADGQIVAIGAPNNKGINGNNSGHVRVYKNISGTWTKIGTDIDGETASDLSGHSVSLSADGSIVAIGAIANDATVINSDRGHVRVFKNIAETWTKIGTDIDGERTYGQKGYSVSLSADGNTVAIGAPFNTENSMNRSGQVRVYDLTTALGSDDFVLERFAIYPNPAIDFVTIQLQDNLTLERVNIYNSLGQLVKTDSQHTINISALAKGTYYFEVYTNQGKATRAVVK